MESTQNELTLEELDKLKKELRDASDYMRNLNVKNDDAVLFVGDSKNGKSTLINKLIGNCLIAERDPNTKLFTIVIKNADCFAKGPPIGTGIESETTIPSKWISKELSPLVIYDNPGFGDTGGCLQDSSNAFYLYQLVQKVKSLRIVLVVDIVTNLLSNDAKLFLSVLNSIESLLGRQMKFCFSNIIVVFTKVPECNLDGFPVNMELINACLHTFISSNDRLEISETSKAFIEYLIRNNNQIALFKRAKLGPITSDIDVGIVSAIKAAKSLERNTLNDVSPSISDKSKVLFFRSREKICSLADLDKLDKIVMQVSNEKRLELMSQDDKTDFEAYRLKFVAIQDQLNNVSGQTDLYEKVKALRTVDSDIKHTIESNKLLENIEIRKFLDKILDLKENEEVSIQLQKTVSSWLSNVKDCLAYIQLKLGQITDQIYHDAKQEEQNYLKQKLELLNEQLKEVKEQNEERRGFFAKFGGLIDHCFDKVGEAVGHAYSAVKNLV